MTEFVPIVPHISDATMRDSDIAAPVADATPTIHAAPKVPVHKPSALPSVSWGRAFVVFSLVAVIIVLTILVIYQVYKYYSEEVDRPESRVHFTQPMQPMQPAPPKKQSPLPNYVQKMDARILEKYATMEIKEADCPDNIPLNKTKAHEKPTIKEATIEEPTLAKASFTEEPTIAELSETDFKKLQEKTSCKFVLTRGKNKGKPCGKTLTNGKCTSHPSKLVSDA